MTYNWLYQMSSETPDADIVLTPGTTKSRIVKLLYNNPHSRFSLSDVRDRVGTSHRTVKTELARLTDDGLIGKTGEKHYEALEHRHDLHRYTSALEQLSRVFEERDYEEHTDVDKTQQQDIDEDVLNAISAELEDKFGRR